MVQRRRKTKAELDGAKATLPYRFVYRVRELAQALGLDMSKLAQRSGVSREAIRRYWYDDVQKPDAETLGKLAQALACEPGAIVQFVRNEQINQTHQEDDAYGL